MRPMRPFAGSLPRDPCRRRRSPPAFHAGTDGPPAPAAARLGVPQLQRGACPSGPRRTSAATAGVIGTRVYLSPSLRRPTSCWPICHPGPCSDPARRMDRSSSLRVVFTNRPCRTGTWRPQVHDPVCRRRRQYRDGFTITRTSATLWPQSPRGVRSRTEHVRLSRDGWRRMVPWGASGRLSSAAAN